MKTKYTSFEEHFPSREAKYTDEGSIYGIIYRILEEASEVPLENEEKIAELVNRVNDSLANTTELYLGHEGEHENTIPALCADHISAAVVFIRAMQINTTVTRLDLSYAYFLDSPLYGEFAKMLSQNTTLHTLLVPEIHLNDPIVLDGFIKNQSLKEILFDGNGLTLSDIARILEANKQLEFLRMHYYKVPDNTDATVEDAHAVCFAKALAASRLKSLELFNCRFLPSTWSRICSSVAQLGSLEYLYAVREEVVAFDSETIEAFTRLVSATRSLLILDLQGSMMPETEIEFASYKGFLDALTNNQSIQELNLDFGRFNPSCLVALKNLISNNRNLIRLSLEDIKFEELDEPESWFFDTVMANNRLIDFQLFFDDKNAHHPLRVAQRLGAYSHCAKNFKSIHETLMLIYRLCENIGIRDLRQCIIAMIYPSIFATRMMGYVPMSTSKASAWESFNKNLEQRCEKSRHRLFYKSIGLGLNAFIHVTPLTLFSSRQYYTQRQAERRLLIEDVGAPTASAGMEPDSKRPKHASS